jgi:hypothetical protein
MFIAKTLLAASVSAQAGTAGGGIVTKLVNNRLGVTVNLLPLPMAKVTQA